MTMEFKLVEWCSMFPGSICVSDFAVYCVVPSDASTNMLYGTKPQTPYQAPALQLRIGKPLLV